MSDPLHRFLCCGGVHVEYSEIELPRRRLLLPAALLRVASDARLVSELRAGSERAFEVLFDRHYVPLLAYCRHLLGSVDEGEDAVQHTFLAAYRELVGSHKPIVVRPWLYTIAHNRCLSILRARRERPVAEVLEPATANLAADLALREELRALLADVGRLPELQRAALVLLELGDLSHAEIADVIGCRPGKVKSLVFMARSSLGTSRAARDTPCWEIREQLAIPNRARTEPDCDPAPSACVRALPRLPRRRAEPAGQLCLASTAPAVGWSQVLGARRGVWRRWGRSRSGADIRCTARRQSGRQGDSGNSRSRRERGRRGRDAPVRSDRLRRLPGRSAVHRRSDPPANQVSARSGRSHVAGAGWSLAIRAAVQRPRHRPPDRPSARRGRSRSSPRDRA